MMEASPSKPAKPPIRPAATLILLRDGAQGIEVFMLRRSESAVFLGGAYVFPGGALDPGDHDPRVLQRISGLREDEANARLRLPGGALCYWIAAVRECFEEAGILLASRRDGGVLAPAQLDELAALRLQLHGGQASFAQLLEGADCLLPIQDIVYFDHWITPPGRPRRFDTRFFVARAPHGQEGSHDNAETVHSLWVSPADALEQAQRKEITLAFATRRILQTLAELATVDEAVTAARSRTDIETNRPNVAQGGDGEKIFRIGDAAYYEIQWSDPQETTRTTYDLAPDVPKPLDPLVTRVIAPNPGMMTGPGTNTYLVGDDDIAVIDPGPLVDAHVAAVLEAARGRIRWILCTHTHRDHSPAAAALREATGAMVIGSPAPAATAHDVTFAPDREPAHEERLTLGNIVLRALHTPGHASNHFCYLLEQTRMLFTGDHVMQGSTVIINPPDGDMRTYLRSLDALLALDIAIIAPGHGYLIGAPHREVRRLIEHRLWRERKVREALQRIGPATLDELVPVVYAEVPPNRFRIAARSLLAHLQKLVADGAVRELLDGRYSAVQAS